MRAMRAMRTMRGASACVRSPGDGDAFFKACATHASACGRSDARRGNPWRASINDRGVALLAGALAVVLARGDGVGVLLGVAGDGAHLLAGRAVLLRLRAAAGGRAADPVELGVRAPRHT